MVWVRVWVDAWGSLLILYISGEGEVCRQSEGGLNVVLGGQPLLAVIPKCEKPRAGQEVVEGWPCLGCHSGRRAAGREDTFQGTARSSRATLLRALQGSKRTNAMRRRMVRWVRRTRATNVGPNDAKATTRLKAPQASTHTRTHTKTIATSPGRGGGGGEGKGRGDLTHCLDNHGGQEGEKGVLPKLDTQLTP